jgi:hypothetical protein
MKDTTGYSGTCRGKVLATDVSESAGLGKMETEAYPPMAFLEQDH